MNRPARAALAAVLTLSAAFAGCTGGTLPVQEVSPGTNHYDISGVEMVVTAGVTGTIWTLEAYSDGTPHPGTNSIDIGAPGGTEVFHQLDGLPADVGGGWIYVDHVQEPGYCSAFNPGDAGYNGAKLRVFTYFYGRDGAYLGYHSAVYQHVEAPEGVRDVWLTWNHPAAGAMWPAPDLNLGNGAEGGVSLGTLFSGGGVRINNTNGKLCHWGDHLHQEGLGSRAGLALQDSVSDRVDRAHLFTVNAGYGSPGEPPMAPPAVGSAEPSEPPPSEPPPEPPPSEPPPSEPPPSEPPPPEPTCSCGSGIDNFCAHAPNTAGCPMTAPGGYCDPNGDGSYEDGDWTAGWYDWHAKCAN